MARINFIVSRLSQTSFTGGILCILEYAHGLSVRGHDVTIVPTLPSPQPKWYPKPVGKTIYSTRLERARAAVCSASNVVASVLRPPFLLDKRAVKKLGSDLCLIAPGGFPRSIQCGIEETYVRQVVPDADIQIATNFSTARPTSTLPGHKFYFMQHFEPYFCNDYADPQLAETIARQSYHLGLRMIANSSWLRSAVSSEVGAEAIDLCPNAIDHAIFCGQPSPPRSADKVIVISYGGRGAVWKGFREMVEAVAIARSRACNMEIEWRVYGTGASVPPQNGIADYIPLGFLSPRRLAEEYCKADILLSASWYESFPLFPIEAMACGLAVVTSQYGTEEYAMHEVTAEIVAPKDPESIAHGLLRLIKSPEYRCKLGKNGNMKSKEFTWERSVDRFEKLIVGGEH